VLALAYGTAMTKLVDPKAIPDALPGEVLDLLYDGLASRAEAESRRRGATTGSSRESRC
jgi:hypothetical protein